jgi:hypothetical protein
VVDNVAVAAAPPRFADPFQIGPYVVTLSGAGGAALNRYVDPSNDAQVWGSTTYDPSTPGPETPLSRAAERNPSTPNPIVLQPTSARLGSRWLGAGTGVLFNVLLNNRAYELSISGAPRAGCIRPRPGAAPVDSLIEPYTAGDQVYVRGDTVTATTRPAGLMCRGTYRISVAVVGARGRPHAPFGTATLTVR